MLLVYLGDTQEKAKSSLLVLDEQNENQTERQNLVMKIIKLMLLSFAFISQVTVFASYAPYVAVEKPVGHVIKPKIDIRAYQNVQNDYSTLIEKYALKWQVSPVLTSRIVKCESAYNRYALNDTPGREFSVGLAQINILAHTNITREQAEDPEFAVNFITENVAKGKAPQMWYTCYRNAIQVE